VRINTSYVSAVYEKKFSKVKTITAVAVLGGAIAVTVRGKGFPFFPDPRDEPGDDTIVTRRGRIPTLLPARPGLPPFLRSLNPPRSH
jgi:hypothetical protein